MHFIVSILMATTAFLVAAPTPMSGPVQDTPDSIIVSSGVTTGGDLANINIA